MLQELVVFMETGIRSRSGTGITLPALFRPDEATAKTLRNPLP